ncbi:MAG TPA: YgjP-like metallopeptidase domain-containing protein [Bacteroidales bacterium]|nr:YgjP-like metallopeptidase domain-containing protein [Bacteroidales bacterium]
MAGKSVSYRIVYSRRRSIGIIISPEKGVLVRAPYRTPPDMIDRFVASKSVWIHKHLDNHIAMVRLSHKDAKDGSELLYRGMKYRLRTDISGNRSVRIENNTIIAGIPEPGKSPAPMLDKWYRKEALERVTSCLDDLASKFSRHNFKISSLTVKPMKRRWGSCSPHGKIAINSELIKIDDIFTEYVILHELCHLHHHNHGREFYNLLGEVFPCWKEVRKSLRNYIT